MHRARVIGASCCSVIAVMVYGCGSADVAPRARPSVRAGAPAIHLELLAFKSTKDGDFGIAEGQVKNVSAAPLQDVVAIVSFMDEQGAVITTAETTIDATTLGAGEVSKFAVMTDQLKNAKLSTASIRFKLFGGAFLEVLKSSPTG